MDGLAAFLGKASRAAVAPEIMTLAGLIAGDIPGARAVLAYGSALRDSSPEDTLIDFYVLVDDARDLPGNVILRALGDIVPPNVCYAEHGVAGNTLRCKYAVMTLQRFAEFNSPRTSNPYLWARFAQPSRIVWLAREDLRAAVVAALATAARTAYGHALFLSSSSPWQVLFENTYRTELRPEGSERAALIVEADRDHYRALSALLADVVPVPSSWAAKRGFGKLWSVARLVKAAFTFKGGADYAAWKIARHSGVKIEVSDWQRRHPLLAGALLLPRLLRSRGLK